MQCVTDPDRVKRFLDLLVPFDQSGLVSKKAEEDDWKWTAFFSTDPKTLNCQQMILVAASLGSPGGVTAMQKGNIITTRWGLAYNSALRWYGHGEHQVIIREECCDDQKNQSLEITQEGLP
jgi:hypothetical protein